MLDSHCRFIAGDPEGNSFPWNPKRKQSFPPTPLHSELTNPMTRCVVVAATMDILDDKTLLRQIDDDGDWLLYGPEILREARYLG